MDSEKEEYLVRGALLECSKGTHPRRLNLPESHGVYVLGHPVIHEKDCVPEENISYFGVCLSDTPPEGAEEVIIEGYANDETGGTEEVQGLRCCPDILSNWKCCHAPTKLTGDEPVATINSYLVCNCKGIISPLTSGQEYED